MVDIEELTQSDVGRRLFYQRIGCENNHGTLSSWNEIYVFARFKGPNGVACRPEDVSFVEEKDDKPEC